MSLLFNIIVCSVNFGFLVLGSNYSGERWTDVIVMSHSFSLALNMDLDTYILVRASVDRIRILPPSNQIINAEIKKVCFGFDIGEGDVGPRVV